MRDVCPKLICLENEFFAVEAAYPASADDPDAPVPRPIDTVYVGVGEALVSCIRLKMSLSKTNKSLRCRNPQISIRVFANLPNGVVGKTIGCCVPEKASLAEPHQAVVGCYPEISQVVQEQRGNEFCPDLRSIVAVEGGKANSVKPDNRSFHDGPEIAIFGLDNNRVAALGAFATAPGRDHVLGEGLLRLRGNGKIGAVQTSQENKTRVSEK